MQEHTNELIAEVHKLLLQAKMLASVQVGRPGSADQCLAHVADCRNQLQMLALLLERIEEELTGDE